MNKSKLTLEVGIHELLDGQLDPVLQVGQGQLLFALAADKA